MKDNYFRTLPSSSDDEYDSDDSVDKIDNANAPITSGNTSKSQNPSTVPSGHAGTNVAGTVPSADSHK